MHTKSWLVVTVFLIAAVASMTTTNLQSLRPDLPAELSERLTSRLPASVKVAAGLLTSLSRLAIKPPLLLRVRDAEGLDRLPDRGLLVRCADEGKESTSLADQCDLPPLYLLWLLLRCHQSRFLRAAIGLT
jgi:hypothetical protein